MKRFIAGVFATALLVAGVSMTASPASAHPDTCTGQGTASTNPVYYPTFGPSAWGPVSFTFAVGGCVLSGTTMMNGTFIGGVAGNYCGQSIGVIDVDGHNAVWVSAGSVLVLTGSSAVGVASAVPDLGTGQSCVRGTRWLVVTGSLETL